MAATNAANVYDLASWAKTTDPNFKQAMIAELLMQSNEVIYDMMWEEGNTPIGHQITQRTGLPTTYTRQLNQFVNASRGQTAQIVEPMAQFQTIAEYDQDLLDLWADKGRFLYNQSLGFMESISQKYAGSLIYGDPSTDATQFLGLAPRYSTVNTTNAANAVNVIDGGGTGATNTSMWLLTISPKSLYGIFPKGSVAGIRHRVNPDVVIQGSTQMGGGRMWAHQEEWDWKCGLAIPDWRWNVRIANVDVPSLRTQTGATDLTEAMIDALYRIPSINTPASTTGNPLTSINIPGKQVFYCNRTVRAALHKQMLNKTNNQLTMEDWYGHKVMTFQGIPIRNIDQILNTEARVV